MVTLVVIIAAKDTVNLNLNKVRQHYCHTLIKYPKDMPELTHLKFSPVKTWCLLTK